MENGRRLENISWRLWYRESSLKKSERRISSTCPIPIQQFTPKKEADKHLSSTSFKRIISSLNENKIIAQPSKSQPIEKQTSIQFQKSHPTIEFSQPIIEKARPIIENVQSCIEVSQPIIVKSQSIIEKTQPATIIETQKSILFEKPQEERSKFFIKEEEEEQGWSSDEEEEQDATPKNDIDFLDHNVEINETNRDETAFLSEFRKRSPINVTTKPSILSNMLHAEHNTRLAHPIHVAQNLQHDELSSSMRRYIQREQHGLGHDFILNSNVKPSCDVFEETFRGYW